MNNYQNLKAGTVTVVGVPWDENSSFMRGPAAAPARIREDYGRLRRQILERDRCPHAGI